MVKRFNLTLEGFIMRIRLKHVSNVVYKSRIDSKWHLLNAMCNFCCIFAF